MTSTSPPLAHLPLCLTPTRSSSPRCSGEPSRFNCPVVFAAAAVSLTLVAGVFAWIATHPHKSAPLLQFTSVAAVEQPAEPELPVAPFPSTAPVFHYTAAREETPRYTPLLEVKSPPLPPPVPRQPKRDSEQLDRRDVAPIGKNQGRADATEMPLKPPAGQTYGTKVLFLNNREIAADMARRERKLMFVMHISGNFEDSCFT